MSVVVKKWLQSQSSLPGGNAIIFNVPLIGGNDYRIHAYADVNLETILHAKPGSQIFAGTTGDSNPVPSGSLVDFYFVLEVLDIK